MKRHSADDLKVTVKALRKENTDLRKSILGLGLTLTNSRVFLSPTLPHAAAHTPCAGLSSASMFVAC